MFNKKEFGIIIIMTIIFAFSITLASDMDFFLYALLGIFIVLMTNILAKKIIAYHLDSEIEIRLWEFKRFGYRPKDHFKKGFPAGAFLPLISRIILMPFNGFIWMASLVFDTKAKKYRTAKRHGYYSFSEITEDDVGYIAAAGVFVNLILGMAFYMIGYPFLAKMNIWYAFFNMIPLSNLDGNKIFFGKLVLWSFLAILTLIGMGYSFLLI